jgi:2-polyprenyl-6-methoxyphenol hydroxylase-like FAD-dependent oxidoreductase
MKPTGEPIIIVGGGITGLTLALSLHAAKIPFRIFEAAPEFKPLGVGINLLPHGMRELTALGLLPALEARGSATSEMSYYNRYGQYIFTEPRGRFAGYQWPQISIHRGHLHEVLADAVRERVGADAIRMNHKCAGVEQDDAGVTVRFVDAVSGKEQTSARGCAAIACDGIHSVIRRGLFPNEGPPAYQGINMWRGVTRWKPFLSGSTMVQAGWLDVGKTVIYPISPDVDGEGRQLINWVAEIQSSNKVPADWTLRGKLEDVLPTFADWHFPWLDVAELMKHCEVLLEFPMVDRDPLPYWTAGRVTLLGDAAHPMYPRGGNGANQGILDVAALVRCLRAAEDAGAALKAYEAERLAAANQVVLTNRSTPPDAILKVVHERSGGKPFHDINDIVSREELAAITDRYKVIAGFDRASLGAKS